jgi:hypothetical protein
VLFTRLADIAGAALIGGLAALPGWRTAGPLAPGDGPGLAMEAATLEPCADGTDAYLRGRLHGDVDRSIDWSGPGLACGGMLRPQGRGMRLMFAPAGEEGRLLFVLGLDATPETLSGAETPVNLTIVDEARGLFFSTGDRERCWVQADRVRARSSGPAGSFEMSGTLYCVGAVPEVNGTGSLTPGDFRFALPVTLQEE